MNKFERIRKRLKDTLPDNSKFLKFDGEIKKGVVSWNNGTVSL